MGVDMQRFAENEVVAAVKGAHSDVEKNAAAASGAGTAAAAAEPEQMSVEDVDSH